MIVLAIVGTLAALWWSAMTVVGNGMRDVPGEFQGGGLLIATWVGVSRESVAAAKLKHPADDSISMKTINAFWIIGAPNYLTT